MPEQETYTKATIIPQNTTENSSGNSQENQKQTQSQVNNEPLDLPFPDIDFEAFRKSPSSEENTTEQTTANSNSTQTSESGSNYERVINEEDRYSDKYERPVKSKDQERFNIKTENYITIIILLDVIGCMLSTSPVNDANFYFHPVCLLILCFVFYAYYAVNLKNVGMAVAFNGSKGIGKISTWYYKNTRENCHKMQWTGYFLFAGLLVLAVIFFMIYGAIDPEPSSFGAYSAVILAGFILGGLWFAMFLFINPDYVKIGNTADETLKMFIPEPNRRKASPPSKNKSSFSPSSPSSSSSQRRTTQATQKKTQEAPVSPDEKGEEGEREVNYQLQWWEKGYKLAHPDFWAYTVKSDCVSKYSTHCIRLASSPTDEPQEFDHLYLTSFGIIAIETKNYTGDIEVIDDGNWKVNGKLRKSPSNQVRRHNIVLQTILQQTFPGKTIPLYSFICLANEEAEILNKENSRTPIVSINSLPAYMDDLADGSQTRLSRKDFWDIVTAIEGAKVGKSAT